MMQKFEYRHPRFTIEPAIQAVFRTEKSGSIEGTCEDVSLKGAGVRFIVPLPVGTRGVLTLAGNGSTLEVKAHIAHLDLERCGIVFDEVTDEQREAIQNLIVAFLESNHL
jgi:hypothetical protein